MQMHHGSEGMRPILTFLCPREPVHNSFGFLLTPLWLGNSPLPALALMRLFLPEPLWLGNSPLPEPLWLGKNSLLGPLWLGNNPLPRPLFEDESPTRACRTVRARACASIHRRTDPGGSVFEGGHGCRTQSSVLPFHGRPKLKCIDLAGGICTGE